MKSQYTLVKSYYGLGGDLCVLLCALHYAQQHQRALVVDWSGGRYGFVEQGNLFNEYFAEPVFLAPVDLPAQGLSVFPPVWVGRTHVPPLTYIDGIDLTLSRPEEVPIDCDADCVVITRDSRLLHQRPMDYVSIARSLRPVPRIQTCIDAQVQRLRSAKHSIGIHFRHGNGERKVIAPDPRWFRNRINGCMKTLGLDPEEVTLYVATDCEGTLEYFRRHYRNTIDLPKSYRPNGGGALHINRTEMTTAEKMQMADEALVDMYVLSHCNSFFGSRGFFSLFVRLLRGSADSIFYRGTRVFDNYTFTDAFYPVERDRLLAPVLKRARQPFDGLFVHLKPDGRHIYYYDEPLHLISVGKTELTNVEDLTFRKAVAARRTY